MIKLYRQRLLSILDTGHMTQKLWALLFWNFYSGWRDVRETPQIIDKWQISEDLFFRQLKFRDPKWKTSNTKLKNITKIPKHY